MTKEFQRRLLRHLRDAERAHDKAVDDFTGPEGPVYFALLTALKDCRATIALLEAVKTVD
jgi:hypothetical protein